MRRTDLIACALIYLGKSANSTEDADLAEVVKLVADQAQLKGFSSDTYIDELAANEVLVAQGWSGDVFQAQDQTRTSATPSPRRARYGSSMSWPSRRAPRIPPTPPAS